MDICFVVFCCPVNILKAGIKNQRKAKAHSGLSAYIVVAVDPIILKSHHHSTIGKYAHSLLGCMPFLN
jgi:hypothetical protein